MKVLEIMERAGIDEPSRAIAYINDALKEISDNETYVTIDIVSGTKAYSLPANFIEILGVYGLYEDNKYYRISRIENIKLIEDITSGSSTSSGTITVV